jgi:AraC-like DNA-binding protein
MFYESYEKSWSDDSIRHIATPSETARATYYYVQEIGYFKTLSHYYTKRSGLNSYLLIYTISGIGHLIYEGKTYELNPGDLMFIDCNKAHFYKTDESLLWEIQWVHFNGSNTKGYYDQFAEHNNPIIGNTTPELYSSWLSEMLLLHGNSDLQREVQSSRLLTNCLTQLLIDGHSYNTPIHLPKIVQSIQTYIDQHYTETITLEGLAHIFGLSKYHLSRLYKRYTGFSPIDYQISQRITQSKNLLQFTDISIQEISYQIGIENISHFINLFKKREALTPLQFRKLWQNID